MSTAARAELEHHLNRLYQLFRRFDDIQKQKDNIYRQHAHLYAAYKSKWRTGMYWL